MYWEPRETVPLRPGPRMRDRGEGVAFERGLEPGKTAEVGPVGDGLATGSTARGEAGRAGAECQGCCVSRRDGGFSARLRCSPLTGRSGRRRAFQSRGDPEHGGWGGERTCGALPGEEALWEGLTEGRWAGESPGLGNRATAGTWKRRERGADRDGDISPCDLGRAGPTLAAFCLTTDRLVGGLVNTLTSGVSSH